MSNYAGNTVIVAITESHSVPAGEYCGDHTVKPSYECKFLEAGITVEWSHGKGGLGPLTTHRCLLFREPIKKLFLSADERKQGIKGIRFLKCECCAQQGK